MIRRLYIHNFRCLENFDLPVAGKPSTLLIGSNGAGKTTVGMVFEILQKLAKGTNRVADLVKLLDLPQGRPNVPMRFEIDVLLSGQNYQFWLALEVPPGFRELHVLEEGLRVGVDEIYSRKGMAVTFAERRGNPAALFTIDWHLVALPIFQEPDSKDPLYVFKQWLSRILVLRPIPSLIDGNSTSETLQPVPSVADFGAWFTGLLANAPAAYAKIDAYLKQVMPDLKDIKNPLIGPDSRSLTVQFAERGDTVSLPFSHLSDGEKSFMICALVLAANEVHAPLLCFWDEPDNYLALSEVGHFVVALRKAFQAGGQFIATSHNPEAIRRFSSDTTLVLQRRSHLEPTIVRPLSELNVGGDLIAALITGDLADES